jgi:hypothetical protein
MTIAVKQVNGKQPWITVKLEHRALDWTRTHPLQLATDRPLPQKAREKTEVEAMTPLDRPALWRLIRNLHVIMPGGRSLR